MPASSDDPRPTPITSVRFRDGGVVVVLNDGRTISAPREDYPRLLSASAEELERWFQNGQAS